MSEARLKTTVLELLESAREVEMGVVNGLSEAERNAAGTEDQWSAKDLVAHIATAKERLARAMHAAAAGQTPSLEHDEHHVYAAHQRDTWAEARVAAERAYTSLVEQVATLDDAALTDVRHRAWTRGESLVAQVLTHGLWHPCGHLMEFARARGDASGIDRVRRVLVTATRRIENLPELRDDAITLYNMACGEAQADQADRALELLGDALRRDPELAENAKDDPDLAALRDTPAFRALVAGA